MPGVSGAMSGGRVIAFALAIILSLIGNSRSGFADSDLVFQLDTGGHTSEIKSIVFTPDGRGLVSAGRDKVVRIWDLPTGKTRRTIRGEISPGRDGEIAAIALSPDGRWLAVGGWFDSDQARAPCCGDIRLYDFKSGRLEGLLRGHGEPVSALAFSPDGSRLVSGATDGTAIVWDMSRRGQLHSLYGHSKEIVALAVMPDGERVVTASADHDARIWSLSDGRELAHMTGHSDKILGLAVAQAGDVIATGDAQGEIRLWDGKTGQFQRVLANEHSQIRALAFARSGRMVVASLGYFPYEVRGHDVASGDVVLTYRGHDNLVSAVAVSPDGRWIASAGGQNSEIHVWSSETGKAVRKLGGAGQTVFSVGFSATPPTLAWGNTDPCPEERLSCPKNHGKLEHEIQLPSGNHLGEVEAVTKPAEDYRRAVEAIGTELVLDHRVPDPKGYETVLDIKGPGGVIASITRDPTTGFRHRAYTFTPDHQQVVSGGAGGKLVAYDLQGQPITDFIGHDSDILAVAVSPDGRYLASSGGDQIVRLWNVKTGELIVNLFAASGGDWAMWTPQGYYAGSPGADRFVGWQVNRGRDKTPDFISAAQLRTRLNRPDIVEKAIDLASAEEAIRNSEGTSFTLADLIARPVPRFVIANATPVLSTNSGYGSVGIRIFPTPDPIKAIRVYVNGGGGAKLLANTPQGGFPIGERSIDVPLGQGRNEVRIVAANAIGETSDSVVIERKEPGRLDSRGDLYIVAVGVDQYPQVDHGARNLSYAGSDAKAFMEAAVRRLSPYHNKVYSDLLVNGPEASAPTASRIRAALDMLRQAQDDDTVVIFLAGHGVNDGENYRFLPTDAERVAKGWSSDKTISWHEFEEILQAAKGRRLLFLDTCKSGNAFNQTLGNSVYSMDVIAYASARWDQSALERPELKHGLFTYALVEGLDPAPQKGTASGPMTTKRLFDFIVSRVSSLAKELGRTQEPQYYRGRDAEDYVLAAQ